MTYKMFIDDERYPPSGKGEWGVVRSSAGAIIAVLTRGVPNFISFDHDLGGSDTAMVFIDWLVEKVMDKELSIPADFSYTIHSQNPVGKYNIDIYLKSFLNFIEK